MVGGIGGDVKGGGDGEVHCGNVEIYIFPFVNGNLSSCYKYYHNCYLVGKILFFFLYIFRLFLFFGFSIFTLIW